LRAIFGIFAIIFVVKSVARFHRRVMKKPAEWDHSTFPLSPEIMAICSRQHVREAASNNRKNDGKRSRDLSIVEKQTHLNRQRSGFCKRTVLYLGLTRRSTINNNAAWRKTFVRVVDRAADKEYAN